jgi:hypothetical protein
VNQLYTGPNSSAPRAAARHVTRGESYGAWDDVRQVYQAIQFQNREDSCFVYIVALLVRGNIVAIHNKSFYIDRE